MTDPLLDVPVVAKTVDGSIRILCQTRLESEGATLTVWAVAVDPYFDDEAGQWQCCDTDWDDDYQVECWAYLPTFPDIEQQRMISIELVEKGVLVNPTLSDALYQLHSINPGLCDKIVQELPRIVILKGDQAND